MANNDLSLTEEEVRGFVRKLDEFRSSLSAPEKTIFAELVRAACVEPEAEGFASSLWNAVSVSAQKTLLDPVLEQRFNDGVARGNANTGKRGW